MSNRKPKISIYLSTRDNAVWLVKEIMKIGIEAKYPSKIMDDCVDLTFRSFAQLESNAVVKAAMDVQASAEKGEDLMSIIAEMITSGTTNPEASK